MPSHALVKIIQTFYSLTHSIKIKIRLKSVCLQPCVFHFLHHLDPAHWIDGLTKFGNFSWFQKLFTIATPEIDSIISLFIFRDKNKTYLALILRILNGIHINAINNIYYLHICSYIGKVQAKCVLYLKNFHNCFWVVSGF